MNSAFNSFGSVDTSKGANQVTKTGLQQRPPTSYTQSAIMPQGVGNMHTNTNAAHSHQNQQHHYSLSGPGQYINQNLGQIPASNHPVANPVATAAGQGYNSQKNISNFQNSFTPPISQPLPASVTQQSNSPAVGADKPHSNGTAEIKPPPQKNENQTGSNPLEHEKEKVQQPEKPSPVQPNVVPMLPPVQEKSEEKLETTSKEIPKPADSKAPSSTPTSPVKKPLTSSPTSQPPSNETSNSSASTAAAATIPDEIPKTTLLPEVIEAKEDKTSEVVNTKQTDVEKNSGSEDVEEEKDPLEANEEEEDEDEEDISPNADPLNLEDDESSSDQEQESSSKKISPAPKKPARKTKAQQSTKSEEALKTPKATALKSPSTSKVKRQRVRTQHYQSPLPEVELISKISSSTLRNNEDKLIVFYKNEFLAVRNAEGGFYLCQAVQNIYRSSSKIKIRWLSQDKNDKTGEIYTPDFYDLTDFDCILTNLSLSKVDKGKFRLPPPEKERTQSILNRSLAVEKGEVTSPSLTEEHPDGLDLSLYRDTDQIKKRRARKRKLARGRSTSNIKKVPTKKEPELAKARKVAAPAKSAAKKTTEPVPKKTTSVPTVKAAPSTSSRSSGRGKRKVETKTSTVVDQKKAKVLAKIGKKSAAVPAAKTTQNSAKNAKSAKSKPSASTSKAAPVKTNTKTAAASKAPPRSTRRSTRK